MSDLRKALLTDHAFRYDIGAEQRADRAVAIVAAWLRDEADALRADRDRDRARADGGDRDYRRTLSDQIYVLSVRADDLAAPLTRPDHTEEETTP